MIANGYFNHNWVVISANPDKALKKIMEIKQSCGKSVTDQTFSRRSAVVIFSDATILRWLQPNSRGVRTGKLWCDEDVEINDFHCIVRPMYMGEFEDIIWF